MLKFILLLIGFLLTNFVLDLISNAISFAIVSGLLLLIYFKTSHFFRKMTCRCMFYNKFSTILTLDGFCYSILAKRVKLKREEEVNLTELAYKKAKEFLDNCPYANRYETLNYYKAASVDPNTTISDRKYEDLLLKYEYTPCGKYYFEVFYRDCGGKKC